MDDERVLTREIAEPNPAAVRGTEKLIKQMSDSGAADHFAIERKIIFKLIGSVNQVEAITVNFENCKTKFTIIG